MNTEGRSLTNDDTQWAKRTAQPLDLSPVPDADLLRELDRRQAKIQARLQASLAEVPEQEPYREVGRRRQAKRKVHRGGPGRPRKPRCDCG
jgi:hypothetical protein